ncbi:MAG: molecular chaperone HtpG [Anaerolineae bacterium]|nr:molecular chaperone HtpG [Anaerolineae bacterium]
MASETSKQESMTFRTEVRQLLNILANSLYTDREIFLRELISNASDALNRIQFEMLTNRDILDPDVELAIHIDVDEEAKTLTISDTGIGMNHDELIENLGTIAHSGAKDFLQQLEDGQRPADIIGQFGVGFYSVFTVADEVVVTTRSYRPADTGWSWVSKGENDFTLTPAEKAERGTEILVKLKDDASEFASTWRLEQIVKKHSNYVSFPIYVGDKVANQQTALWRKSPSQVEDKEYEDFYRQLTLDFEAPLLNIHLVTDAPVDIRSILFIPKKRDRGLLQQQGGEGLRLYSKKVLIQEHFKDLLPEYLRFVEGIVDSQDLPLNISRETVQSNRIVRQIQKALTGRVLKSLRELMDEKPEDYIMFWQEFGYFIKEGIATNPFGQDDLTSLLRFQTTNSEESLVSLDEYVERMPESQAKIYYILGDSLNAVSRSPHLDYFRDHNLEVLYLVDPLDGFMMQNLREYQEKAFQNVDDPDIELPEVEKEAEEKPETRVEETDFGHLIMRFKDVLGERVKDVRESHLLTDSPCRLVSAESGPERDLQRVRRLIEKDYEVPVKILEINRGHPLVRNLAYLIRSGANGPLVDSTIEQLFENLLLLEGLHPNPAKMVPRIQTFLEAALQHSEAEETE